MTRSKRHLPLVALMAASLATACATTSAAKTEAAQTKALQQAVAEATAPASAEERAAADRSDPITRANFWSREHTKNGQDLPTALSFADALTSLGSHDRVIEVMSDIMVTHPESHDVFMTLGRALSRDNKLDQSAQSFLRAATLAPERADSWSALGTVFAKMDRHVDAQEAYSRALAVEPLRAATLTNYGLSLALTGDLDEAEAKLRLALDQPDAGAKTRENLALILGLQGKYDEMKTISGRNAPSGVVEDNATLLREMVQPARTWDSLSEKAVSGQVPATPTQTQTASTSPAPAAAPSTKVDDTPLELAGMPETTEAKPNGLRLRRSSN